MTDVVSGWRWFHRAWLRRAVFALLIIILVLMTLFPERYEANVKLAPQETSTAGLSAILSQLGGNYAALLGNHQPVEIDLSIGRSYDVQSVVARKMGFVRPNASRADIDTAVRKVSKMATVSALRGNVMEIVASGGDPDVTLNLASVYAGAMQGRLAELSRAQTTYKRSVLNERMHEATDRLARAEAAINHFRADNRIIAPEEQLGAAVGQLNALRARAQAVQIDLAQALRTNSEQSFTVRSLRTQLGAINVQIAAAGQQARSTNGLTASGIAPRELEFQRLNRELRFSQALYDSYTRYLEGAAIENLTADFNMQIIEPPYLEPSRQFNFVPLALLAVVALMAVATEFYMFRPPVSRRALVE